MCYVKKKEKDNFKQRRCFACITLDNKMIKTVWNFTLMLWYLCLPIENSPKETRQSPNHIYTMVHFDFNRHTRAVLCCGSIDLCVSFRNNHFPVTVSAVNELQTDAGRIEPVTIQLLKNTQMLWPIELWAGSVSVCVCVCVCVCVRADNEPMNRVVQETRRVTIKVWLGVTSRSLLPVYKKNQVVGSARNANLLTCHSFQAQSTTSLFCRVVKVKISLM